MPKERVKFINYQNVIDALMRRGDPLSVLAAEAIEALLKTVGKLMKGD